MMKGSRNAKGVEEWSKAGSFVRKPDKGWLHSAQAIKDGGVCYALKYLGCIEVLKSMRTLQYDVRQQVTKEAMYRCCEANGYKFSKRKKGKSSILKLLGDHPRTVHSGTFISLTVSVSGIVLTEMSSGEMISKHDMQGISFASGGEKDCPEIVGYVAKDAKNKRACHVLDCPQNLSYDVINTIGQAFELRYKMFLDDPPQLLPVPKRFDGSIFGGVEQQSAERFESSDRTYDQPKYEPEDEFADGYIDDFEDEHEYDSPAGEHTPTPLDEDSKHYQKPRSPPCEMSKYDTPHSTIDSHSGEAQTTTSMEFAVGTQFDTAVSGPSVNMPSYNNPLASVPTVDNLRTFYDTPGDAVNGAEQESNGASFRVNWETFDEDMASSNGEQATAASASGVKKSSPEPALPERADSPQHNTLGYALPKKPDEQVARRTPPPLPKPYSRKDGSNPSRPPVDSPRQAASIPSPEDDLSRKDWFHGPMSRQDAENMLVCDGDFLVRESTTNPGQFVLTGLQNGYPKHLLLIDPEGVVRTKDHAFESVDHLVRYHRDNKVPIISSGSVIILRQPVVRDDPSQSAYDRPI